MDSARRRDLRRIGHHLQPVVTVGDAGLSEGVLAELGRALEDHELIKVRLPGGDRAARSELATALCAAAGAELVQSIGRMVLIYRAAAEPDPRLSNILREQSGR